MGAFVWLSMWMFAVCCVFIGCVHFHAYSFNILWMHRGCGIWIWSHTLSWEGFGFFHLVSFQFKHGSPVNFLLFVKPSCNTLSHKLQLLREIQWVMHYPNAWLCLFLTCCLYICSSDSVLAAWIHHLLPLRSHFKHLFSRELWREIQLTVSGQYCTATASQVLQHLTGVTLSDSAQCIRQR